MSNEKKAADAYINRRRWLPAIVVLFLAGLLFFSQLGSRGFWKQEGRWGEIAREMILSGNYFWPTINGHVYYGKPLLSFWLVAGSAHVTGALDETAARLPNAVFGLIGVLLVMLLAGKLYDRWTAILAGVILATSYSYLFFSRLATADMGSVVGVLAALTLFTYHEADPKRRWVIALWLVMAVASLTKGLTGFALPLMIIGVYTLMAEGWSDFLTMVGRLTVKDKYRWWVTKFSWLLSPISLAGAVLGLLIYVLPFALSALEMHSNLGLQKVWHENVVRFFAPFDHKGPVYLYTYAIFMLAAPWSVFLPGGLAHLHLRRQAKRDRFLSAYFWTLFVFFTLSGSRRSYYILPILPAVALIIARPLAAAKESLQPAVRRLITIGYGFLAIVAVAGAAFALLPAAMQPQLLSEFPPLPKPFILTAIVIFIIGSVLYSAITYFSPRKTALLVAAMTYSVFFYLHVFVFSQDYLSAERTFAQQVKKTVQGDYRKLVLYRVWGPALLFYLGAPEPVTVYRRETDLAARLNNNRRVFIVGFAEDLEKLKLSRPVITESQEFVFDESVKKRTEYVLLGPALPLSTAETERFQ